MVCAVARWGSVVERPVYLGKDELGVVREPYPSDQQLVLGQDEQWQRLGQSFEHDLLWRVDGQQPDPRNVFGCRPGGKTGALEPVPENLVEGELSGNDMGEFDVRQVQAKTDLFSGSVEPICPVGVHLGGLNRQVVGRGAAG